MILELTQLLNVCTFRRSRDNLNERIGDERADWWRRFPYSVNEAIRMARTSVLDEFINLDHGWWFAGIWSRRHRYFRLIWTFDSSLGIPRLKESNLNNLKRGGISYSFLLPSVHHDSSYFFACSMFSLRNVGRMIDVVKWCAFLLFLHKVAHDQIATFFQLATIERASAQVMIAFHSN